MTSRTREERIALIAAVDGLRVGDLVCYRNVNWPVGHEVTGAVYMRPYVSGTGVEPCVAGHSLMAMATCGTLAEFEVVGDAAEPFYVNDPRVEPKPGDIVRDADSDLACIWVNDDPGCCADGHAWRHSIMQRDLTSKCEVHRGRWFPRAELPPRLRLLVDGATGQVVDQ